MNDVTLTFKLDRSGESIPDLSDWNKLCPNTRLFALDEWQDAIDKLKGKAYQDHDAKVNWSEFVHENNLEGIAAVFIVQAKLLSCSNGQMHFSVPIKGLACEPALEKVRKEFEKFAGRKFQFSVEVEKS